jgi:hypothetical protein
MARAIVRYSWNNTAGKYQAEKARKDIRDILEGAGIRKVGATGRGTASWELIGASTADVAKAHGEVIAVVEGLPAGVLDHIWIYCDE